ncbi:MAG: hypothetical protein JWM20_980 [Patescibacteria group bacterium]|nr:hypothetical protein [Patescibacteria group bacterium]
MKKPDKITVYVLSDDFDKLKVPGYTRAVIGIKEKARTVFLPNKYFKASDQIFEAIFKETGYAKKAVRNVGRTEGLKDMREAFVYLFFKKFPNVTFEIVAYFINRSHYSVLNAQANYNRHMKPEFKKHEDTILFWDFINRVQSCLPKK